MAKAAKAIGGYGFGNPKATPNAEIYLYARRATVQSVLHSKKTRPDETADRERAMTSHERRQSDTGPVLVCACTVFISATRNSRSDWIDV